MSAESSRPATAGEYDEGMQALLQIVWGEGFLSPGGAAEVACILEGTDIRGRRVLDIGSGLGAVDVLLAREHGAARVVGIDVEPSLVRQARARAARERLADRLEFLVVTPGPLPFAGASFDVVFSKDALVQIPDKPALFAQVRRVLAPGGVFVASDWLCGEGGADSPAIREFIRLEGITYNLASASQSVAALGSAGFRDIEVRDRNAWYSDLAQREVRAMKGEWQALIEERLGPERARHFVADWEQLQVVLASGELRPTHLKACVPAG
jgi:phosphoethanolamine N-methyltransferase